MGGFFEEHEMPLVNVRFVEGVFSPAQKQAMIHQLTEAMVAIEGDWMRSATWVVLEEVKSGQRGMGGKSISTEAARAMAAEAA